MNAGFLAPSVSRKAGGLFPIVRSLARELSRLPETQIEVFSLRDRFTDQDLSTWDGIPVNVARALGPRAFGYAPGLARSLRLSTAELLHVHGIWMYPSVVSLRWAGASQCPYVISPQGMLDPWAVRNSRWKKRLAGWLYENAHLRGAACIHALCEAEARAVREYGLTNPICVIPNGVDLPEEGARGSTEGPKILLYLGRLHPKKGLPGLLRGWKLAREQTKVLREWQLVIAGWDQGGHQEDLERLCREQGIEGVRFVGPQFGPDKAAAFQAAEAFVLPSLSEGLPVAVLEAWSYRLPVVMTPECNLPEGFQAGAALRIEPEPENIARGLTELIGMREAERRAMGTGGRRLVEEKFSWPKIAEQMKSVYEWVLGGGPKPDCFYTQ